jgi:hypothetical protein
MKAQDYFYKKHRFYVGIDAHISLRKGKGGLWGKNVFVRTRAANFCRAGNPWIGQTAVGWCPGEILLDYLPKA